MQIPHHTKIPVKTGAFVSFARQNILSHEAVNNHKTGAFVSFARQNILSHEVYTQCSVSE